MNRVHKISDKGFNEIPLDLERDGVRGDQKAIEELFKRAEEDK